MKVIDDFLQWEDFLKINNLMLSPKFSWFYNSFVDDEYGEDGEKYQFTHTFYKQPDGNNSEHIHILNPLFKKLNAQLLVRVKANMNPKSVDRELGVLHRDVKYDCNTAIYYVNSNNGYTEFEDGTIVKSVANRMAVFSSDMLHRGVSQTDTKVRCVINCNWFNAL